MSSLPEENKYVRVNEACTCHQRKRYVFLYRDEQDRMWWSTYHHGLLYLIYRDAKEFWGGQVHSPRRDL